MSMTFMIAVEMPGTEDCMEVHVEVHASYGDHGIGSYEYWGFRGRHTDIGWEIETWDWDKSLYTKEQNDAINEACYREQSNFIEAFEQQRMSV